MTDDELVGRDALDSEHQRIFREAQRAADTIFSHYQLSQLLATHARSATMAEAVLDELLHVCDAVRGGIWLTRPADMELRLVASAGDQPIPPPDTLRVAAADAAGEQWVVIELEEVGLLALAAAGTDRIDAAARRFLSLVRHELAGALRAAQLGETLELERKELSAIIQNASDAVLVFDADRRVTRGNPAAERLFGRSASSIVGEGCAELYLCEPVEALGRCARCPLARLLEGGEPLDGEERVIIATSGQSTSVVGSYAPTSATSDGRSRAVAILRDTSELARLAELRRGFLASVSHELRTPIALIKGYVETMLHLEPDPATARRYLERIDETTDRLGHLVEQILDATQLAAGQLVLELDEVDLLALVGETIEQVSVGAHVPRPSLEITGHVPSVHADRDRLRQVLENLLANAQRYGDQSPIGVRVEGSDGIVEIRVSDRGIGIPAGERELVFEQFHRASNVRERGMSGSGLGLAISRRIVEAHGGTLGFDPDPGIGTTAILRLPVASPVNRGGPSALTPAGSGV
jgi:two-component system phosphate regulon sensor histidine kinase PhoR